MRRLGSGISDRTHCVTNRIPIHSRSSSAKNVQNRSRSACRFDLKCSCSSPCSCQGWQPRDAPHATLPCPETTGMRAAAPSASLKRRKTTARCAQSAPAHSCSAVCGLVSLTRSDEQPPVPHTTLVTYAPAAQCLPRSGTRVPVHSLPNPPWFPTLTPPICECCFFCPTLILLSAVCLVTVLQVQSVPFLCKREGRRRDLACAFHCGCRPTRRPYFY